MYIFFFSFLSSCLFINQSTYLLNFFPSLTSLFCDLQNQIAFLLTLHAIIKICLCSRLSLIKSLLHSSDPQPAAGASLPSGKYFLTPRDGLTSASFRTGQPRIKNTFPKANLYILKYLLLS
jgi:hypothetical protein